MKHSNKVTPAPKGRPKGSGVMYGQSLIEHHQRRGKPGNLKSNRLSASQHRVQQNWTSVSLVPIVHAVRKMCEFSNGRFKSGSFTAIKRQFPSMLLSDSTIRRCFFKGDELLADANLVKVAQLGNHDRHSRRRKGFRQVTSQGRSPTCVGPLFATGLWHRQMRQLQLQVPRACLVAYFLDELEAHKEMLESALTSEPDNSACEQWKLELAAVNSKIYRFTHASGSARNKAVRELEKTLRVRKFTVQNRTDLTPAEQRL